jgi:hypothetical protein
MEKLYFGENLINFFWLDQMVVFSGCFIDTVVAHTNKLVINVSGMGGGGAGWAAGVEPPMALQTL